MKIVYAHIERYHGPSPGGKENGSQQTRNKKDIFFFKQEGRNDKIIDDIIICRDKNKIAEFNSHCFRQTDRVRPENDHPKTVNGCPKKDMEEIGFDCQFFMFIQK